MSSSGLVGPPLSRSTRYTPSGRQYAILGTLAVGQRSVDMATRAGQITRRAVRTAVTQSRASRPPFALPRRAFGAATALRSDRYACFPESEDARCWTLTHVRPQSLCSPGHELQQSFDPLRADC